MISLDTNVLVYAADRQAGNRHAAAHQLVTMAIGKNVGLTEQSLIEFLDSTTRKAKLSLADAATTLRGYLSYFTLLMPQNTIVEDAIALLTRHKLSVWDARMLAVCAAHGCSHLLSEDMQDGARYGGVTVVNPFNPANAAMLAVLLNP